MLLKEQVVEKLDHEKETFVYLKTFSTEHVHIRAWSPLVLKY